MLGLLGKSSQYAQTIPAQVVYSGAGVAVPATFAAGTFDSPTIVPTYTPTVDTTANTITIGSNNGRLWRAETFSITASGSMPAPLESGVQYEVTGATPDGDSAITFTPALDGVPIDLTSGGSGMTLTMYTSDLGLPALTLRTLDSAAPTWAKMNTADGVYEWDSMDEHIAYHCTTHGRKMLFTFNQTPTWAASNAALDAYGYSGGGQVPTDMTKAATFITQFLTRYGSDIFGVEIWNEPSFSAPGTASANWCGTMAQLAEFGRLVSVATKAVSASYKVLSPGFTAGHSVVPPGGTAASAYNWLVASDGDGGQGKDWIDGACYHGYGIKDSTLPLLAGDVKMRQSYVAASGLSASFPMYQTERGITTGNSSLLHIRCMAIEAALGVQMSVVYAIDFYGDNPRDNTIMRAALSQFYSAVCGKTLTYCAINADGSVTVTADGVTWRW